MLSTPLLPLNLTTHEVYAKPIKYPLKIKIRNIVFEMALKSKWGWDIFQACAQWQIIRECCLQRKSEGEIEHGERKGQRKKRSIDIVTESNRI